MYKKIFERAKAFNLRAFKDRIDERYGYSLVSLAISLELLGKSYLAKTHPSLLAEKGNFDSLLHLVGAGGHSKMPPFGIRTISASETISRCCQMQPKLKQYEKDIRLLTNIRNSIVHMGEYDPDISNRIIVPYAKFVRILLSEVGEEFDDFFEEFAEIANEGIVGALQELELHVRERLLQAKARYQERFGIMDQHLRNTLIRTIVSSYQIQAYDEDLVECPACGNYGVATGSHDVVAWEEDVDRKGVPIGAYPVVMLFAESYSCGICGLKLKSTSELQAAGIEPEIELADVDPEDFYEPEVDFDEYY